MSLRSIARNAVVSTVRSLRSPLPVLALKPVRSLEQYQQHASGMLAEYERRTEHEHALLRSGTESFVVPAFCSMCRTRSNLLVDYRYSYDVDGVRVPNWREQLSCQRCRLNNRRRATIHILEQEFRSRRRSDLYITEQMTPLFNYVAREYRHVVGSEYLGESIPFGTTNAEGLRNETLTALTFADDSYDAVLSFEVLEHIPDYHQALSEALRVLRPGGRMLFTAPFNLNAAQTLIRATINSEGTISHLLEPEYHGDPLSVNGVLCFQHFGWDLATEMKRLGFKDVVAWLYWSEQFGYLGREQAIFAAYK